ncbi:ATP-binding protein [Kitasatospora herbaricolor]|uniref:ATP-binding protein n=1 Tax=Kitasatospora herbaricolor TaxID=68217 RepID=A0ABZ1W3A4_9ACTN|nr:ATP-binding protein [Kitasatospora herbaricolor]
MPEAGTLKEQTWTDIGFRAGAAFDGAPGTAAAARRFADDFLAEAQTRHGVPVTAALAGTVRLVVSELVTNAAKYAPGPCLLDLELTVDDIRVTVWDTEARLPAPRSPDPARVGQHGLEIVLAVCRRYDIERHAGGKRVRAHLPLD